MGRGSVSVQRSVSLWCAFCQLLKLRILTGHLIVSGIIVMACGFRRVRELRLPMRRPDPKKNMQAYDKTVFRPARPIFGPARPKDRRLVTCTSFQRVSALRLLTPAPHASDKFSRKQPPS